LVRLPIWFWAAGATGVLFLWPFAWLIEFGPSRTLLIIAANTLLNSFVCFMVSSSRLTHFRGLVTLSLSFQSGCANFSAIYMVPLLVLFHLLGLVFSIDGLLRGRAAAQDRWHGLVNYFHRRRTGVNLDGSEPEMQW
jgi:hypothetical protein